MKLREEVKKRGAERWKKLASREGSGASLATAAAQLLGDAGRGDAAAAVASQVGPRVRLEKRRWRGVLGGGVKAEQTELEVSIANASSSAEGHGALPWRYRTICFEGSPRHAYELVGELLGLPKEWKAGDLQRVLDSSVAEACKAGRAAPAMAGGYPRFVAAVAAAAASDSDQGGASTMQCDLQ